MATLSNLAPYPAAAPPIVAPKGKQFPNFRLEDEWKMVFGFGGDGRKTTTTAAAASAARVSGSVFENIFLFLALTKRGRAF